jgi:putative endonuclease
MGRPSYRRGRLAEEHAARYLEGLGYAILARNWHCPAGEVDIIAREGEALVLVEVRARRQNNAFSTPEETITSIKGERLMQCGGYLVAEWDWDGPWRIDLVAVDLSRDGQPLRCRLIRSAVEG